MNRLREKYIKEVVPSLTEKHGYKTPMLVPKLEKIVVNMVKKHLKPKNNNGTGEIIETEAPIHASNVMLIDPKTKKATKIKYDFDKNGKKIRVAKKSNEKID